MKVASKKILVIVIFKGWKWRMKRTQVASNKIVVIVAMTTIRRKTITA